MSAHRTARRRLAPALVAAAFAASACASMVAPAQAAPVRPAPAQAAPAASVPVVANAATVASIRGEAVPWKSVSQGWTLAELTDRTGTQWYLVNPAGAHYRLGPKQVAGELADVSGDGQRALFLDASRWPDQRVTVMTLKTRATTTFVRRFVSSARFTNPSGAQLLLVRAGFEGVPIDVEKRTLTGRLLRTYPQPATPGYSTVLPSMNGKKLVVTTRTGFRVYSDTGRLLRTIKTPSGYGQCTPRTWWNGVLIAASCDAIAGGRSQVFLMSTDGAATRQLTRGDAQDSFWGYLTAWPTSRGVFVARVEECPSQGSGLLSADGRRVQSFKAARDAYPVAGAGDRIYYAFTMGCSVSGPGMRLVSYDVRTGRLLAIAGGYDRMEVGRYAVIDAAQ